MLRLSEEDIRLLMSYDEFDWKAKAIATESTESPGKYIIDIDIPGRQIIRMKTDRLRSRRFGSLDAMIKACKGITNEIAIKFNGE